MSRRIMGWLILVALGVPGFAHAQAKDDLSDFKTVATAITTTIRKGAPYQKGSSGYLGVLVADTDGKLVVGDVEPDSPAADAGLKTGDVITKVDGQAVKTGDVFRSILQSKFAGDGIKISVQRDKETLILSTKMVATSRVMQPGQKRAILGVQIEDIADGEGVTLKSVTDGMPAAKAGLKAGDIILKIDGKLLSGAMRLNDITLQHKPGDVLSLLVKGINKEKDREVKVTLAEDTGIVGKGKGKGGKGGKGGGAFNWDNRAPRAWTKDTYRLAIVSIEYPDVKLNEKITTASWEEALFSAKKYTSTSITGQKVHGSLNDYYQEQSFQKLKVVGKCFKGVTVSKKRSEYAAANTGPAKTALL
ncbi:MAG TPA: PDZ domain-containing protein, partial [Gemmataceae bacterium]|nr:PDZ domain-containing protein [Gemmataceae bacterium]